MSYSSYLSYPSCCLSDPPITDFDQAIAIGPSRAEFFNNRGVLQAGCGAWENALADFDAAVRICPDLAPAWANRAIVRARLDQMDLALKDVHKMLECASTMDGADAVTVAWISIPDSDNELLRRFRDEAASTAAGNKVWVVDANKKVFVYDTSGGLLGSWTLGSLNTKATVQGITTNGTDIWVVDSYADKVYKYAGAASRIDGSQNAASSFSLNKYNKSATDIVTDGTSLWVVDNSTIDKVFKYTVGGSLASSWTITTPGATSPTGITIDPADVGHIWIVDNGTDRVYQYDNAATQPNGSSKAADAYFLLASGNANPQGIADPPAPRDMPAGGEVVKSQLIRHEQAMAVDDALIVPVGDIGLASALPVRRTRVAARPLDPTLVVNGLPADNAYLVGVVEHRASDVRSGVPDERSRYDRDALFAQWDADPLGLLGLSDLGLEIRGSCDRN